MGVKTGTSNRLWMLEKKISSTLFWKVWVHNNYTRSEIKKPSFFNGLNTSISILETPCRVFLAVTQCISNLKSSSNHVLWRAVTVWYLHIWYSEDRASWYNKNQRDALISHIYFWNRTLHVSDRFSVHHQESSTVHTEASSQHILYVFLCVQY